jgi:DNA-binding transcriptional ArsR family regulator
LNDLVFGALADPTRREILFRLAQSGPQPSGQLVEGLGMSRQGASRHLEVLEAAGLVRSVRKGRVVMRELERTELQRSIAWMNSLAQAWDERLRKLEASYLP